MKTSEKTTEIVKALVIIQGNLKTLKKDIKAYNYYYSNLASLLEEIREPFLENGLFLSQDPLTVEDGVSVTTTIFHTSGQYMEWGPLVIPVGKKDAHSTGSSITYSKRYALCAALGIATEDDDGQSAQKSMKPAKTPKDNKISNDQWESLNSFLNGHEELRNNLKKLCNVTDLSTISETQLKACRDYSSIYMKKEKNDN